jgi:hypothetical protein
VGIGAAEAIPLLERTWLVRVDHDHVRISAEYFVERPETRLAVL